MKEINNKVQNRVHNWDTYLLDLFLNFSPGRRIFLHLEHCKPTAGGVPMIGAGSAAFRALLAGAELDTTGLAEVWGVVEVTGSIICF